MNIYLISWGLNKFGLSAVVISDCADTAVKLLELDKSIKFNVSLIGIVTDDSFGGVICRESL